VRGRRGGGEVEVKLKASNEGLRLLNARRQCARGPGSGNKF